MAGLLRVLLLQAVAAAAAGDFYGILGVPRDASKRDISAAFRRLSLRWHPDKNVDAREEAERRMRELSEAYTVLAHEEDRRIYDSRMPQRSQDGWWRQTRQTSGGQTQHYTYESYSTKTQPETRNYYTYGNSREKAQAESQFQSHGSGSMPGEEFYYVRFD
jgi:DnaJ-class molecular chaperone